MSIILPILFFVAGVTSLVLFHFLKLQGILKLIFLGLAIGFGIASIVFGFLFAYDTFKQDDPALVFWATFSLYVVLICIVMFIYTIKWHKAFGISFLAAILIFGTVFLVIGFAFGRSFLDNERIIESTSKLYLCLSSL